MSAIFDPYGSLRPYDEPEESLEHKIHRWTSTAKTNERLGEDLFLQLYAAIDQENEAAVRMLLDAGIQTDLIEFNNDSFSCLQAAAQCGHRGIARMLWDHVGPDARFQSSQDPNTRQPHYGHGLMPSCLVIAARNGHAELVGDFLDWYDGWWNREKCMALHDAAAMWRGEVVGLLLDRIPYEQDVVQVALQKAFGLQRPKCPDCVFYWRREISPIDEEGEIRMVERLIDAGANPNRVIQDLGSPGHGRLSRQMSLPIHMSYNRFGLLKKLLEKGADPNLRDGHGRTVLHKIAELFDQPFLEVHRHKGFEHRAVPSTDQDGTSGTTSTAGGSSSERGGGIGRGSYRGRGGGRGRGRGNGRGRGGGHQRRFFLSDASCLSDIYPYSSSPYVGDRPTKSNCQDSNLAALHLLFQHSASPTIADNKGETPLHLLASTGSLEAFRLCLSHCKDTDAYDTALHDLNSNGESLLHYAAAAGNEAILTFLLDPCQGLGLDPNLASSDGWTPFLCALHPVKGKSQAVSHRIARFLLWLCDESPAAVAAMAQVVTKEGWSPMHALATPWHSSLLHFCDEQGELEGEGEDDGRYGGARETRPWMKTDAEIKAEAEAEASLVSLALDLLFKGAAVDSRAEVLKYRRADASGLYGKWGGRMRVSAFSAPGGDDNMLPYADEELTPWWWARETGVSAVENVLRLFLEVRAAMERNLNMGGGDVEQMEVSGQIVAEALARNEMEGMKGMNEAVGLIHLQVCLHNGEVRY